MSAARARAPRAAFKDAPLDPAAEEAIERFARVLAQCGYPAPAVRKTFEAAMAGSAGRTKRARAAQRLRELPDAPHLVTLWCSTPEYVDERGTPRRLPARGPGPSIESLARRVNRSFDLDEVLRYLVRTRTVRKVGGAYALNRRWILLRGISGPTHGRVVRELAGMLRTLEHNMAAETDAQSWFEFTAENPRFPVSQLPAFNQRLRRVGLGCLRKLDVFMRECEAERDTTEPTVWLGVGMHRFEQDLRDPNPSRAPSAPRVSPSRPSKRRHRRRVT
jgi:hypothetical protein